MGTTESGLMENRSFLVILIYFFKSQNTFLKIQNKLFGYY